MATGPLDWQTVRARPAVRIAIALAGAALVLILGLALAWWLLTHKPHGPDSPAVSAAPAAAVKAPVGAQPPGQTEEQQLAQAFRFQTLTPDQARAYNAGIPISTEPNPPARPFVLPAKLDAVTKARATDCLTAAIYYEAAHEPADGQRAVAQVVLNRVRHFAYPKTVCDVVFQNADQPGACQFTFACDGSMVRPPEPALWKRIRTIAEQALAGKVAKSVGRATHYHAEYVAPYWQPTLVKVAVIGQHIFYRGGGDWSTPQAFAGAYAGSEPDQPLMAALWSEAAMPPVVDPGPAPPKAPPVVALPPIAPPEPQRPEAPGVIVPAEDPPTLTPPSPLDAAGTPAAPLEGVRRYAKPKPPTARRTPG